MPAPERGMSFSPPVLRSSSSVFPEPTSAAVATAAALGYDGVEEMVWTDAVSQDAAALRGLADHYGQPVRSVHAPCLLITQRVWSPDPWERLRRSAALATELIDLLNGAVGLSAGTGPVRFGGAAKFTEGGTMHRTLFAESGAFMISGSRVHMITIALGPDGKEIEQPPQPSEAQRWIEVGETDKWLNDALIYFGRSHDWFDAYKTLECLFCWAGSESAFIALGWASLFYSRYAGHCPHVNLSTRSPEGFCRSGHCPPMVRAARSGGRGVRVSGSAR